MPTQRNRIAADGVTGDDIAAELTRTLSSAEFLGHPKASAFLKFIVEETLAGREVRLKAYTVGTLALGQPESFDPQSNSLVRVQATRLRAILNRYHVGAGADASIWITIPLGGYVPHFDVVSPPSGERREACVTPRVGEALDASRPARAGEQTPFGSTTWQRSAERRQIHRFGDRAVLLLLAAVASLCLATLWFAARL